MFILLEDLVKSCVRGREEEKGGHVLRDTLAAACMDESDHLALVNAGDEEVRAVAFFFCRALPPPRSSRP